MRRAHDGGLGSMRQLSNDLKQLPVELIRGVRAKMSAARHELHDGVLAAR